MPYQSTIQRTVEIEGVGLHTAVHCHMRFVPAPADTG
ncbi:MAG: UDP-3-O-acyl-N-acetylglucosamine deacetylase, partial [Candidatus Acidiferrales bacterium]